MVRDLVLVLVLHHRIVVVVVIFKVAARSGRNGRGRHGSVPFLERARQRARLLRVLDLGDVRPHPDREGVLRPVRNLRPPLQLEALGAHDQDARVSLPGEDVHHARDRGGRLPKSHVVRHQKTLRLPKLDYGDALVREERFAHPLRQVLGHLVGPRRLNLFRSELGVPLVFQRARVQRLQHGGRDEPRAARRHGHHVGVVLDAEVRAVRVVDGKPRRAHLVRHRVRQHARVPHHAVADVLEVAERRHRVSRGRARAEAHAHKGATVEMSGASDAADPCAGVRDELTKLYNARQAQYDELNEAYRANIKTLVAYDEAYRNLQLELLAYAAGSTRALTRPSATEAAASSPVTTAAVEVQPQALRTNASGGPELGKYRKMLQMGLPDGAVMQAMTKDGVDPALLFTKDDMRPTVGSTPSKFIWTRITLEPEQSNVVPEGSIWKDVQNDAVSGDTAAKVTGLFSQPRDVDIAGAERRASATSSSTAAKKTSPVDTATLQNFGIMSRNPRVLTVVKNFDYKTPLPSTSLALIRRMIPESPSTLAAYAAYRQTKEFESAIVAEQDLVELVLLPGVATRIELLKFAMVFKESSATLQADMRHVRGACSEATQSVELKQLMVSAFSIVHFIRKQQQGADVHRLSFADVANLSTATAKRDTSYSILDYILASTSTSSEFTEEFMEIGRRANAASQAQYEAIGTMLSDFRATLKRIDGELVSATGDAKTNMLKFVSEANSKMRDLIEERSAMEASVATMRQVFGIPQNESLSKAFEDLAKLARVVLERTERARKKGVAMSATSERPSLFDWPWW